MPRNINAIPSDLRWFIESDLPPVMVSRARSAAHRVRWRVKKSSEQTQHINNRGGLMLVDGHDLVVHGHRYDLTAEEVIRLCLEVQARLSTNAAG